MDFEYGTWYTGDNAEEKNNKPSTKNQEERIIKRMISEEVKKEKRPPSEYDFEWYKKKKVNMSTYYKVLWGNFERYAFAVKEFYECVGNIFFREVNVNKLQPSIPVGINMKNEYDEITMEELAIQLKVVERAIFSTNYSAPPLVSANKPLQRLVHRGALSWLMYRAIKRETATIRMTRDTLVFDHHLKSDEMTEDDRTLLVKKWCERNIYNVNKKIRFDNGNLKLPRYTYKLYEKFTNEGLFNDLMIELGLPDTDSYKILLEEYGEKISNLKESGTPVQKAIISFYGDFSNLNNIYERFAMRVDSDKHYGRLGLEANEIFDTVTSKFKDYTIIFKANGYLTSANDCIKLYNKFLTIKKDAEDSFKKKSDSETIR